MIPPPASPAATVPADVRCPRCFEPLTNSLCRVCGWRPGRDNEPSFLPLGTLLDGRYRIGRVIGHGGFGITYLSWDENLHLKLAIKEYLPHHLAARAPDGIGVESGGDRELFAHLLLRFLDEARVLARFDGHPGIVGVKNYIRANGTGYIVMEYVEGITLKEYLKQRHGRIPFAEALALLMPVMEALREVHEARLLRWDIAPDNIRLAVKGQVMLLDFGAARSVASLHKTVVLKPGYAPLEQYLGGDQGPWTDVYALAATLYECITGRKPRPAWGQGGEDQDVVAPSQLGVRLPASAETALLTALALWARDRTRDIATLQQGLQRKPAAGGPLGRDRMLLAGGIAILAGLVVLLLPPGQVSEPLAVSVPSESSVSTPVTVKPARPETAGLLRSPPPGSKFSSSSPEQTLRDYYMAGSSGDCQRVIALRPGYSKARCGKWVARLDRVETLTIANHRAAAYIDVTLDPVGQGTVHRFRGFVGLRQCDDGHWILMNHSFEPEDNVPGQKARFIGALTEGRLDTGDNKCPEIH